MPRHRPSPDSFTPRQYAGALLLDLPRYAWSVLRPGWMGGDWTRFGNRNDRLRIGPEGVGVLCDWAFTRPLHLCAVFPGLATPLMRRALRAWPVRLQAAPAQVAPEGLCSNGEGALEGPPEVSILIGHRGLDRLPLLHQVLKSIAAQQDARFECIVVEQSPAPEIEASLPDWVRYLHTPCDPDMPYCRSWAYNVAASMARSPLLLCHDNDMLLPAAYAACAFERFRAGYEVVNLKRFIFYLAPTGEDVENLLATGQAVEVDQVIENLAAGGSLAISRDAYENLGGLDEAFVGWGGEDDEFWDRCLTRTVWNFTFLPIVHLWHAPQPGKRARGGMGAATAERSVRRRALLPEQRIAELVARPRGRLAGPVPAWRAD